MSLSFANNKFSFNNDGDVTFGSSEDNLRVFFVKKGEEMSDVMKLSYEVKFRFKNLINFILINIIYFLGN